MEPSTLGLRAARRGFTLIELLTVIAIIAILAGLLFPVMKSVGDNARKSSCMSNLHSIIQGMEMYKDDWQIYPDALYGYSPDGVNTEQRLYPHYVKDEQVFNCPTSPARMNNRNPVQPTNMMVGAVTAYYYPQFDSYDFQFRPSKDLASVQLMELHYNRKWTTGSPSVADDPRQLLYKEPPDDTVVTWCLYHSDMNTSGIPAKNALAVVAFKNGRVQTIPAEKLINWTSCGSPTNPCPWQVRPKP